MTEQDLTALAALAKLEYRTFLRDESPAKCAYQVEQCIRILLAARESWKILAELTNARLEQSEAEREALLKRAEAAEAYWQGSLANEQAAIASRDALKEHLEKMKSELCNECIDHLRQLSESKR